MPHFPTRPSKPLNISSPHPNYSGNLILTRRKGLGDVLLALPVAQALKRKFPRSSLFFRTSHELASLVSRFSFLSGVLTNSLSVFDPIGSIEINLHRGYIEHLAGHRMLHFARLANITSDFKKNCEFKASSIERNLAVEVLANKGIKNLKNLVGIAMHATTPLRCWKGEQGLVKTLLKLGLTPVLLRKIPYENSFPRGVVDTSGTLSIEELTGLISYLSLLISVDSGILHLAGFLGIPTVCLFGPFLPEDRIAYYDNFWPLVSPDPKCSDFPCLGRPSQKCNISYPTCMSSLSVDMIKKQVLNHAQIWQK